MRSKTLLTSVFCVILLLSGCITIEEHYSFKKNGSGTMSYVVDMTEMGEMMDSFSDDMEAAGGSVEETEAKDPFNDIPMSGLADSLRTVPGISKVKYEQDGEYYYKITYAFKDLVALNKALNILMSEKEQTTDHVFFRREGNKLIRTHNESAEELGNEFADGEEGGEEAMEMLKMMKYEMSYKFKEELEDVQCNISEGAVLNDNNKSYELKTDFSVIDTKEGSLDITFEFK